LDFEAVSLTANYPYSQWKPVLIPTHNLLIRDNGIGFEPQAIKKGAGLNNIQNRVYLSNGTLFIESAPGKGCPIEITNPI
jgi:signal transduction histidine kinase